jgi:hypothetical protein
MLLGLAILLYRTATGGSAPPSSAPLQTNE